VTRTSFVLLAALTAWSAGGAHAATCSVTNTGPFGGDVSAVVVSPTSSEIVYAATRGAIGVFKSTDGGASWVPSNDGLMAQFIGSVFALELDPADPDTLYAATTLGVFKSTDGAESWAPANTGLSNPSWQFVMALAMHPTRSMTLYAATMGGGVFRSIDDGRTWTFSSRGLTATTVRSVAVDPQSSDVVYAGIEGGGVARSRDGGETWRWTSRGLTNPYVNALAIDPLTPTTLYAGTLGGVFKSSTGAGSWSRSLSGVAVASLAIDPQTPGTVYAGLSSGFGARVLKTVNGGGSWREASSGLQGGFIRSLAIDPTSPSTLYAAAWGEGVFKSTDGAATWKRASAGITDTTIAGVVIDPTDPQTVYAAGALSGTVFKSVDGGGTWTLASEGLPTKLSVAGSLAIDPMDPRNVYVGLGGGLYRSSDGAATWAPVGEVKRYVQGLVVDPNEPNVVYVGSAGGVYRIVQETDELRCHPPEPPPGPYLASSEVPGFRFKVRITAADQVISGRQEADCLGETLCVGGALAGRSELLVRMTGPRPNGFFWTNLVRFTNSRVEVWAEQTGTGEINYYDLPALPQDDTELSGFVDKEAFLPTDGAGGAIVAGSSIRSRPLAAAGVVASEPVRLVPSASPTMASPEPLTFTSDALPGYRFTVHILSGGEEQPARLESDCLPETACVSGAVPGRSELFLRLIGPRQNGFLWAQLVRFTTSRVEVEIEEAATGQTRTYVLAEVPRQSDRLPGRVDRQAFAAQ